MLTGHVIAVEKVPQLGALVFRIPLPKIVAVAEEAFLGTSFLFVASCSTHAGVVLAFFDGIEERSGLQSVAARLRSGLFPHASGVDGGLDAAHHKLHPEPLRERVTEFKGLREIVPGVDVHQRHGDAGRGECLRRQMRHHNAVFSAAEEDGRSFKLGGNLAQHEHRFRFQFVQMVQLVVLRHSCPKVRGESRTTQFSVSVPRPFVKIVQGHLQHTFCNGHTRGFLHSFGVVLEKKPS